MVVGLPLLEQPKKVCGDCVLGKQHRDSFPIRKSKRAKYPLEIIHSDIVVLSLPYLLERKGILLLSLMIIVENLRYIFLLNSQKH